VSAKNTSSAKFGECYRLLAQHYLVLANLEEDCAHLTPFARQYEKVPDPAPVRSVAGRDVCSAAIADGGSLHGDPINAADDPRRDPGR
jgi:hypothetical protein